MRNDIICGKDFVLQFSDLSLRTHTCIILRERENV